MVKYMKEEDRELLLVDLCARLSYGVICQVDDGAAGLNDGKLVEIDISKELVRFDADYYWDAYIDDVKLYLRPMSSMTEEEKKEYYTFQYKFTLQTYEYQEVNKETFSEYLNWLNKNMFDYRGLIEKGLALEAPEGMYGKEEQQ